jgi:hypothetical protein
VLFAGISREIVANCPSFSQPGAQVLSDLDELNRMHKLVDGTVPLEVWLRNAATLAGPVPQAQIFRRAIEALPERSSPEGLLPATLLPLALGGKLVRRASYEPRNPDPSFDRETTRLLKQRVRRIQALVVVTNTLVWTAARMALTFSGASMLMTVSVGALLATAILTGGLVIAAVKRVVAVAAAKAGVGLALNAVGHKIGGGAAAAFTGIWAPVGVSAGIGLATGTVAVSKVLVAECNERQDIAACEAPCADGAGNARSCFYLGRAYGNIAFAGDKANVSVENGGYFLPANYRKAARLLQPLCVFSDESFREDACVALVDMFNIWDWDLPGNPVFAQLWVGTHVDESRGMFEARLDPSIFDRPEIACHYGKSQYACVILAGMSRDEPASSATFEKACDAGVPYGCDEAGTDLLWRRHVPAERARGVSLLERARDLYEDRCKTRCLLNSNINDKYRGRECMRAANLWLGMTSWGEEPLGKGGEALVLLEPNDSKAEELRRRACDECDFRGCRSKNTTGIPIDGGAPFSRGGNGAGGNGAWSWPDP